MYTNISNTIIFYEGYSCRKILFTIQIPTNYNLEWILLFHLLYFISFFLNKYDKIAAKNILCVSRLGAVYSKLIKHAVHNVIDLGLCVCLCAVSVKH